MPILFKHWIVPVLFTIVVQVLLCLPGTAFPKEDWTSLIHLDKFVHVFLFGMLCFLWCRHIKLQTRAINQSRWTVVILIAAIANGVLMEFIQKNYIPFRSFDAWDIVADIIGVFLGFWMSKKIAHPTQMV